MGECLTQRLISPNGGPIVVNKLLYSTEGGLYIVKNQTIFPKDKYIRIVAFLNGLQEPTSLEEEEA
ncbi:MAG: hypothetical protein ACOC53_02270 [Candidatus Saliniplasma sp.]